MSITVRRLITALKKLPPDAKVCWCDHDQDPESGELNGPVHHAEPAPPALRKLGYGAVLS
jgi:hypothetical protein